MPQKKNPSVDFKGFDDFIQIATVGTYTASNGEEVTFTEEDFDQMIANTAPNEAPFVIGHPKVNAPAYGWGVEYKRDGDKLFVKGGQINPEFSRLVESGAYKKRSFSVAKGDAGWKIKHIGWLGAAAPAISGMADVQCAADDNAVVFEFSDTGAFSEIAYQLQTVGNLFRSMRDKMIETEGVEAADRFFSEWQINNLQNARESIMSRLDKDNNAESNFSEANFESVFAEFLLDDARQQLAAEAQAIAAQAAADELKKQTEAQFSEQIAQLSADKNALQAQIDRQAIDSTIAAWRSAGKITPAKEAGIADFMASLRAAQTFEFSVDGESQTVSQAQFFTAFVDNLKPVQLGNEVAGGKLPDDPSGDADGIASAARDFTESQLSKGIEVSWTEAVLHVSRNQSS